MGEISCRGGSARDGHNAYDNPGKGQPGIGRKSDDRHAKGGPVPPFRRARVKRLKRGDVIQQPDGGPDSERQRQCEEGVRAAQRGEPALIENPGDGELCDQHGAKKQCGPTRENPRREHRPSGRKRHRRHQQSRHQAR